MKIKIMVLAACVSVLTGCASGDYKLYAEGQAKIEEAKYNADAARWKAMGEIAANGTESAKIAAVVAMAMSAPGGGGQNGSTKMQAPQANEALQWASLLVPSVTQLAGISANMRMGITQSDNAARVAISTNDAFVGIAGKIQAPASNVSTTTTTTFSGTGVLGSGTYSTVANPTTTTTSNANPTTTTTTTNANPTTTTTSNANPTTTTTVTCTGNTATTGNNGCPNP